jgi:hypothetical protein
MTRTAAVRAGRRHALVERMGIFVRVVDANGFSRAADTLELPRGSVSKRDCGDASGNTVHDDFL